MKCLRHSNKTLDTLELRRQIQIQDQNYSLNEDSKSILAVHDPYGFVNLYIFE